ncbi:MAG: DUF4153 domain-containing protein [Candidatus Limnocylindria bacterium]
MAPTSALTSEQGRRAALLVLTAVAFGLLAQLLFYGVGLGVNYPATIAVVLIVGWLARPPDAPAIRLPDAWLPAAALTLAAFVALRGDATLVTLDVLGSLALVGAALASFAGVPVVEQSLDRLTALGRRVLAAAAWGAVEPLGTAARSVPPGRTRGQLARTAPVVRGLVIAIPLLLVFGLLFAAADAVFARYVEDFFNWQADWDALVGRSIMALVAAWLAAGMLAFISSQPAAHAAQPTAWWVSRPRIGTAESLTVLSALNILFAIFVAVQATYLFGGLDTLKASGLTYAEYARRGFFELLAVAFGVATVILLLEAFVTHRSRAYVVTAVGLVALTMVVLASAYLRLRLYQDAYGWTELRFYVLAAIMWLAIGAAGTVLALATNRTRWLIHGMMGLSIMFGIAFNVIGPVRFIAERNAERAVNPSLVPPDGRTGLDVYYLAGLGTDADIVLAEALPRLPPAERAATEAALRDNAAWLAADTQSQAWQAWNYSRQRARAMLTEESAP